MEAWAPLVGASASDIFKQHADPLGALSKGSVPALILRSQLSSEASAKMLRRLPPLSSVWKPTSKTNFVLGKWRRRSAGHLTLGTDLKTFLVRNASPAALAHESRLYDVFYTQQGLEVAFEALHGALFELGAHRHVGVGRDVLATNATISPGIFRHQGKGATFLPHFDTLHAHRWDSRKCPGNHMDDSRARARIGHFPDLYRFDEMFSALLMLQPSDCNSPITLFDTHWKSLLDDCRAQGHSHEVGVNVGASFDNIRKGWNTTIHLGVGDVYVFNSNRVHRLDRVIGSVPRLTLGSFVGYSQSELRIFA